MRLPMAATDGNVDRMIIGVLIVVLNTLSVQEHGFILSMMMESSLCARRFNFLHIRMSVSSDLGDYLLTVRSVPKKILLGNVLEISFPNGMDSVLSLKLFQGVYLDGGDAFLANFQTPKNGWLRLAFLRSTRVIS